MELLQLEAAIGAGAVDERRGRPARGAGELVGVAGDDDGREAFTLDGRVPLAVEQLTERRDVFLLNQEVRLRASTFTAATGRAADKRGDAGVEATFAQLLDLGDRAGHRRNELATFEQCFGLSCVHRFTRSMTHSEKISGLLQTQKCL